MFENIITFPFVQIADGLRYLSLYNSVGNVVAILLYGTFCLIPALIFARNRFKQSQNQLDFMLIVISAIMFWVIYQLINPALIPGGIVTKALPCITLYSIICTYLILRLVNIFSKATGEKLCSYFIRLLWVLNAVFALVVVFNGIIFVRDIKALQIANEGYEYIIGTTYLFMALGFLVDVVPVIASGAVVVFAIKLVEAYMVEKYSQNTVILADKLVGVCKTALVITVVSTMGFNVLQYLFADSIQNINSEINIPIFSIIFVLALLILSQIISDSKALKDDVESII